MGPLSGIRIIEFGGIGAIPFCGQMLADMGANIIRIERKGGPKARIGEAKFNVWFRGRNAIYLDFKKPEVKTLIYRMIDKADGTIEGFRPGVMERLGLGPDVCLQINQKLIYGRLTGYGRQGPLSETAGHDINYLALSGGLNAIGHKGCRPVPPLNILADLGGGGLMLAFGMVCAMLERKTSGKGQVVDASMVDGCAALLGTFYGWWAAGVWQEERGVNLLDSGAPFYDTYETLDGKYIAIGAIEPEFYASLMKKIGLDDVDVEHQMRQTEWHILKKRLTTAIKSKTRDEWTAILEGEDTCFAPVLSFDEAIHHPHNLSQKTFLDIDGVKQPAPTPRFSRTQPEVPKAPKEPDMSVDQSLAAWGLSRNKITELQA